MDRDASPSTHLSGSAFRGLHDATDCPNGGATMSKDSNDINTSYKLDQINSSFRLLNATIRNMWSLEMVQASANFLDLLVQVQAAAVAITTGAPYVAVKENGDSLNALLHQRRALVDEYKRIKNAPAEEFKLEVMNGELSEEHKNAILDNVRRGTLDYYNALHVEICVKISQRLYDAQWDSALAPQVPHIETILQQQDADRRRAEKGLTGCADGKVLPQS